MIRVFILLVCVGLADSTIRFSCPGKRADIVFLLDNSGSVGDSSFKIQLDVIKNMSKAFLIGPGNVQFSVVTFSSNVRNQFYLNQYWNKSDVSQAIDSVRYDDGSIMVAEAMQFVMNNNFKASHGARQGIAQMLVVIIDGKSNNATATRLTADLIHKAGIEVMAIGVGSGISQSELLSIATDANHTFAVSGLDALPSIEVEIHNIACDPCNMSPADIVFLLDSSGSVSKSNFEKQLEFVSMFVQQFKIDGSTGVRIGLTTFSTNASQEFFLNTYMDKMAILSKIQSTQHKGGKKHTELSFQCARTQFTVSHGMRPYAKKIAIVLTDGKSEITSTTIKEARTLKDMDVEVVAIGIGGNINQYELNGMATNKQNVYTVSDFDFLRTIRSELTHKTCGVKTPAPTINSDCTTKPADIVFLLDSSTNEGSTNFSIQLDFVRQFVDQFVIGSSNIQITIVLFSSRVHNQFFLKGNSDKASLKRAINAIRYQSGTTHTEDALNYARVTSFKAKHGGRPGASKIVIVMTDGQSATPRQTRTEATKLKNVSGIKVISIGIGNNVDHSEIQFIATDSAHAFAVADFNSLHTLMDDVTCVACQTCGFLQNADIAFLLHSNESEGSANFGKQLNFVNRFISDFTVGPNNVQFSLAQFSSNVKSDFYFNTYTSKPAMLSAVQRTVYVEGNSDAYSALKWVRHGFTAPHGARSDASHFVIILTDGSSKDVNMTLMETDLLKNSGVKILSIGIGSKVNLEELTGMASDSLHAFRVTDFDALPTIKEKIKKTVCADMTPSEVDGTTI